MTIRKIIPTDSPAVAAIIRKVMPEFGADGAGFAIHDKSVDDMYSTYDKPGSIYWVCESEGKVVGGAGIAQLEGGGAGVCELQKMYFLPEVRGKGCGQSILTRCLQSAVDLGYDYCYLETFNTMKQAMKVYERNGFKKILGSMGKTGHFACDTFYGLDLTSLRK
jgi:putative acetyltransferase